MSDDYYNKMNEDDLKKFYMEYESYTKQSNVYNLRKSKKKSAPIKMKISFSLRPSEEFIEEMERRVLRVQEALDDLRDELYLYSDD